MASLVSTFLKLFFRFVTDDPSLVFEGKASGLYYKHVMIVNYTSSSVNKLRASLNDDARVIIYDHHMFLVQATGACLIGTPLGYPQTLVNLSVTKRQSLMRWTPEGRGLEPQTWRMRRRQPKMEQFLKL